MPIKISNNLKSKLPEPERKDIEKRLWDKSGGVCFLCEGKLYEATDEILADHDVPESESGPTTLTNLNLVHLHCNAFKRNHPTVDARPYLRLDQLIRSKGGFVKYDQAADLLGITPTPFDLVDIGHALKITIPGGTTHDYPVFEEKNKEGTFRHCYVDLPKQCLYNDDECQPRTIKPQHVWSIYNDINRNPLHEAPACRIAKVPGSVNSYKALLFDGQHKALSFWVAGRNRITTKIYIDISRDQAIRLVNSIQAKIKKLPLSPFELASKMSEEWQERVARYESSVGTEKASEDGFIKWVEKDERARAKAAFEDALFEEVLSDNQLVFREIVQRPGQSSVNEKISEAAFRNKILKPLLHTAPLAEAFPLQQKLRQREHTTIVKLLNIVYDKAFKPEASESPQDRMRAKRMLYQSSLSYVMTLLRNYIGHLVSVAAPRQLLEKEPDSIGWAKIEECIDRLLAHPVWTAALDKSDKMTAVKNALEKNQDAARAFGDVGLKLGYIVGVDSLDANCLD